MQVIRQDNRCNRIERPLLLRIPPRRAQIIYLVDKDGLAPVVYRDREKIRSTRNEESAVVRHAPMMPVTTPAVKQHGGYRFAQPALLVLTR